MISQKTNHVAVFSFLVYYFEAFGGWCGLRDSIPVMLRNLLSSSIHLITTENICDVLRGCAYLVCLLSRWARFGYCWRSLSGDCIMALFRVGMIPVMECLGTYMNGFYLVNLDDQLLLVEEPQRSSCGQCSSKHGNWGTKVINSGTLRTSQQVLVFSLFRPSLWHYSLCLSLCMFFSLFLFLSQTNVRASSGNQQIWYEKLF